VPVAFTNWLAVQPGVPVAVSTPAVTWVSEPAYSGVRLKGIVTYESELPARATLTKPTGSVVAVVCAVAEAANTADREHAKMAARFQNLGKRGFISRFELWVIFFGVGRQAAF
jgi:hypothetical protein